MKRLAAPDRDVLHLLSQGVTDENICVSLQISQPMLKRSVKRIEERAAVETDDGGRFYERALRSRAERLNQSLTARLHALMDVLPQAVLIINGRTGLIIEFNQVACDLFGYSRAQLQGLSMEELVPPDLRAVHPAYRLGFLRSVRKREMGYHPPIFGLCQDGSQVEIAIALTATPADDDVMVVCTERSRWKESKALETLAKSS